ncbi:PGN_0703 family putative restriction endonuclease [Nocardioides sp. WG-D5]
MRLLRPNVPPGISVWRQAPGGPITETAWVDRDRFVWCGLAEHPPPRSVEELAARPGREQYRGIFDLEKGDFSAGGTLHYLGGLIAAGLTQPRPLTVYVYPSGETQTILSSPALEMDSREDLAMRPRWDDAEIFPAKESPRLATYRRHQSWYRENVLGIPPGRYGQYPALGSYLPAQMHDPAANFLTAEAHAHALDRIKQVKAEGGSLDPVRLSRNLLSSMPMCFNLFGSLRSEPAFLTLFQQVFDPAATRIADVVCEYAPQPPAAYLGDRTAFDAIVFYETNSESRFLGIETKYTEPFSATAYSTARYREVTATSGWFADPDMAHEVLRGSKSNQLWRNLILAAALEQRTDRDSAYPRGAVAVVALADDPGAASAIRVVREHLVDQNHLIWTPLETILDAADQLPGLAAWSGAFRLRYLV